MTHTTGRYGTTNSPHTHPHGIVCSTAWCGSPNKHARLEAVLNVQAADAAADVDPTCVLCEFGEAPGHDH
jgi:hypothetical protein